MTYEDLRKLNLLQSKIQELQSLVNAFPELILENRVALTFESKNEIHTVEIQKDDLFVILQDRLFELQWEEMYKMIFDLQISNANNEISKYHKMIAFMQTVRPLFEDEGKEKIAFIDFLTGSRDDIIISINSLIEKVIELEAKVEALQPDNQPKCRIYGSEISFELFVPEKDLKEKVADIWDNSSNYWDVKNLSDEAYYSFIKFLWIDFPSGETVRLSDYANDNNII